MKRNKVVGVHDGVDETVEYYCEVHISIIADIDIKPIKL